MIHTINPDLVDVKNIGRSSNKERLQSAFHVADSQLGIPQLLDPEGRVLFRVTEMLCFNWHGRLLDVLGSVFGL